MLVHRSLLVSVLISATRGVVTNDEVHVLHDHSLSRMEIQWSQTLESFFTELKFRLPIVPLKSINLEVKNTVTQLRQRNSPAFVIITKCKVTQRLPEHWFVQPKALFIDLEPCNLPNRSNSVPLTWAKVKPEQFAHAIETWVQNWRYKPDKGFNDFASLNSNLSILTSIEETGKLRLNGSHLRVGTVYHPPVSFKRDLANGTITFYGPLMELLQIYKNQLNFTYTLTYPPTGRGTGKMNALALRGELDVLFLLIFMGERGQPMYTTCALYLNEFGILIPPPEVKRDLYSSLKPFAYEVWFSLLAGCVLIALLVAITIKLQRSRTWSYETAFLSVFGVAFNQGGTFTNQLATRFLVAGWCLALVVLVNSYSSLLISFITVPIPVPLVDDLEDLATTGRIKPSTASNTMLTAWFDVAARDPSPSLFKTYYDIFNKHPEYYAKDLFDGGKKVFQGSSGFIDRKEALEYVAALDFATTGKCRSMIARRGFRPYMTSIGFRLDFPYVRTFNTIMMRTLEVGLRNHWDRLYVPRNPCRPLDIVLAETPVLSNQDLWTAYLVFGVGSALSIITFLLEHVCFITKLFK